MSSSWKLTSSAMPMVLLSVFTCCKSAYFVSSSLAKCGSDFDGTRTWWCFDKILPLAELVLYWDANFVRLTTVSEWKSMSPCRQYLLFCRKWLLLSKRALLFVLWDQWFPSLVSESVVSIWIVTGAYNAATTCSSCLMPSGVIHWAAERPVHPQLIQPAWTNSVAERDSHFIPSGLEGK